MKAAHERKKRIEDKRDDRGSRAGAGNPDSRKEREMLAQPRQRRNQNAKSAIEGTVCNIARLARTALANVCPRRTTRVKGTLMSKAKRAAAPTSETWRRSSFKKTPEILANSRTSES